MSRQNLPANQQRHDNVSVVRLKAGRFKFEACCYRNKAQSYRNGVEKDIEEVLQIERVFANVGKGCYAKIQDVRSALGAKIKNSRDMNDAELERAACELILNTGTMQINEMERQAEVDGILNDVATFVSEKTHHAVTKIPYPVSLIHSTLQKIGFVPTNRKSAKVQALEAIKLLQTVLEIERAPMMLRATVTKSFFSDAKDFLDSINSPILNRDELPDAVTFEFSIKPSEYRIVDQAISKGGANCSVQVITSLGDEAVDADEVEQKPLAALAQSAHKQTPAASPTKTTKKKDRKKNRKMQLSDSEPETVGKGKFLSNTLQQSDGEDATDRKKNKKANRKRDEQKACARVERRKKDRERQAESDEDNLTTKEAQRRLAKEKEDERKRQELLADPNYYDSDEFGSDYDEYYALGETEIDFEDFVAQKREARLAAAEAAKETAEPAQMTRKQARQKRKMRNKKGERIHSSDEEGD